MIMLLGQPCVVVDDISGLDVDPALDPATTTGKRSAPARPPYPQRHRSRLDDGFIEGDVAAGGRRRGVQPVRRAGSAPYSSLRPAPHLARLEMVVDDADPAEARHPRRECQRRRGRPHQAHPRGRRGAGRVVPGVRASGSARGAGPAPAGGPVGSRVARRRRCCSTSAGFERALLLGWWTRWGVVEARTCGPISAPRSRSWLRGAQEGASDGGDRPGPGQGSHSCNEASTGNPSAVRPHGVRLGAGRCALHRPPSVQRAGPRGARAAGQRRGRRHGPPTARPAGPDLVEAGPCALADELVALCTTEAGLALTPDHPAPARLRDRATWRVRHPGWAA